jgi:putative nucleotidyltransferase with HDIG domain
MTETQAGAVLAGIFAERLGFCSCAVRRIRVAALLHDIGKQAIPAHILNRPGPLTAEEYDIMKTHTAHGAEMLSTMRGELGAAVRAACLFHHEWYDGGGYWGRRAAELPAYIPVISICDVFMALISDRPYKAAWTQMAALQYLREQAGTQFSGELVDEFHALIGIYGHLFTRPTSGRLGQR